jgi:hypothetical protein
MKNTKFLLSFLLSIPIIPVMAIASDEKKEMLDPFKLSGYCDISYNHLNSNNQFFDGTTNRNTDVRENGITLDQIATTLSYIPESGLGGLVNIIFGRDALVFPPYGYRSDIGHTDGALTIYQLYGQYSVDNFIFMGGLLSSLVGYEGIDPTANKNFSRSFLSTFTQPGTHFGGRVTYTSSTELKLIFGLNDGWDDIRDFNRGPTYELGMAYTPNPKLSLSIQGYFGKERVNSRTISDPIGLRGLIDIICTYQLTDKLQLAANYDYGWQRKVNFNGASGKADWSGFTGYINYGINDQWRVSLRGEIFDDNNKGYRTGSEQVLKEATITLGYSPVKNIELRAETRRDISSIASYQDKDLFYPRKFQQSYAFEVVISLPS